MIITVVTRARMIAKAFALPISTDISETCVYITKGSILTPVPDKAKAVPKAPMLTAKRRDEPANTAGQIMGSRTLRKVIHLDAPKL